RPREAVAWALRFEKPVLYVLGNHEFYGSSIDAAADELKQLCAGTHVKVLDNREIVIGRVRFLGTTLWTDFELFGEGEKRAAAMTEARRLIRDFSRIALAEATNAVFSPEDSAALFKRHASWLDDKLVS
ncbi:MAG TPA: metallophosphoesterase, partial [Anaerolineae bacterium]|nr:metallophosphoesterase [Anaerolineae bacterium]